MSTLHHVRDGDTLLRIAGLYGFRNWKTIYDHEQNETLRQERPDPNVLYPGDVIFIPDKEPFSRRCEPCQRHTFVIQATPMAWFRTALLNDDGLPATGVRYVLTAGREVLEGATTDDGLVEQQIRPDVDTVELKAWLDGDDKAPEVWHIALQPPPPITEIEGLQVRLRNLGFPCGDGSPTGVLDDTTRTALRDFQVHIGHPDPTGEPDALTREALTALHDAPEEATSHG